MTLLGGFVVVCLIIVLVLGVVASAVVGFLAAMNVKFNNAVDELFGCGGNKEE